MGIHPRYNPIWENECEGCCIICDYFDRCKDSCHNNDVTCNYCKYNEENGEDKND